MSVTNSSSSIDLMTPIVHQQPPAASNSLDRLMATVERAKAVLNKAIDGTFDKGSLSSESAAPPMTSQTQISRSSISDELGVTNQSFKIFSKDIGRFGPKHSWCGRPIKEATTEKHHLKDCLKSVGFSEDEENVEDTATKGKCMIHRKKSNANGKFAISNDPALITTSPNSFGTANHLSTTRISDRTVLATSPSVAATCTTSHLGYMDYFFPIHVQAHQSADLNATGMAEALEKSAKVRSSSTTSSEHLPSLLNHMELYGSSRFQMEEQQHPDPVSSRSEDDVTVSYEQTGSTPFPTAKKSTYPIVGEFVSMTKKDHANTSSVTGTCDISPRPTLGLFKSEIEAHQHGISDNSRPINNVRSALGRTVSIDTAQHLYAAPALTDIFSLLNLDEDDGFESFKTTEEKGNNNQNVICGDSDEITANIESEQPHQSILNGAAAVLDGASPVIKQSDKVGIPIEPVDEADKIRNAKIAAKEARDREESSIYNEQIWIMKEFEAQNSMEYEGEWPTEDMEPEFEDKKLVEDQINYGAKNLIGDLDEDDDDDEDDVFVNAEMIDLEDVRGEHRKVYVFTALDQEHLLIQHHQQTRLETYYDESDVKSAIEKRAKTAHLNMPINETIPLYLAKLAAKIARNHELHFVYDEGRLAMEAFEGMGLQNNEIGGFEGQIADFDDDEDRMAAGVQGSGDVEEEVDGFCFGEVDTD